MPSATPVAPPLRPRPPAVSPRRSRASPRPRGADAALLLERHPAGAADRFVDRRAAGPDQALRAKSARRSSTLPVLVTQHMHRPSPHPRRAHHQGRRPPRRGRGPRRTLDARPHLCGAGGKHMVIGKQGTETVVLLNDLAPVNFCKPAVDPAVRQCGAGVRAAILACVLTGHGSRRGGGCDPDRQWRRVDHRQDEESSVVWACRAPWRRRGPQPRSCPLRSDRRQDHPHPGGRR